MQKTINKVVKVMILSDFFFNYAWGLLAPIFAIFIVEKITAENPLQAAKIVGFAALIYWVLKSLLQIPIGKYLDKNHGEKDDFWFTVIGAFLCAIIPLGYLISSEPWHIYGLQALYAVAMALHVPSWYAIFTRHIDKGREAYEWSLESTILGFAAGVAAAIGGILVSLFGFEIVFILVSVINIFAAFLLFLMRKEISPKNETVTRVPPEILPY